MFAGLIVTAVIVLILALIVGAVVFLVSLARHKENNMKFDMKSLLKIYLYIISFTTLIIAAFGAVATIKATLSFPAGYPFSYRTDPYYQQYESPTKSSDSTITPDYYKDNRDVLEVDGKKYMVDYTARKKDLVNGITIVVSMLVLFAIHRLALYYIESKEETISGFKKFYAFVSLTLYSILGIIALPAGIYQLINYAVFDSENLADYGRSIPGESVAAAIVFVPLWLIFLVNVFRIQKKVSREEVK